MGLQLGIPILLCLIFQVNVLIIFVCALMWVLHEIVAHWDVHYARAAAHDFHLGGARP